MFLQRNEIFIRHPFLSGAINNRLVAKILHIFPRGLECEKYVASFKKPFFLFSHQKENNKKTKKHDIILASNLVFVYSVIHVS